MFYKGKYLAPSERKPIPLGCMMMRLAAVLVCLVLVSFHLMGGLYARYSSTATGSDSARVAKFDVDVTFSDGSGAISNITATVKYNEDAESYTITVANNSEVAISYKIRVEDISFKTRVDGVESGTATTTGGLSVQLVTDTSYETVELQYGDPDAEFQLMNLDPGSSQQTHTLRFPISASEWNQLAASCVGESISVTIDFKVVVDVTQVD